MLGRVARQSLPTPSTQQDVEKTSALGHVHLDVHTCASENLWVSQCQEESYVQGRVALQSLPTPSTPEDIYRLTTTITTASPTASRNWLRLKDGATDRRSMREVIAATGAARLATAEVRDPLATASQAKRVSEMKGGEKGTVLGRVDVTIDAARCPKESLGRSGWRSQGLMPNARFERQSRTPGTPPPNAEMERGQLHCACDTGSPDHTVHVPKTPAPHQREGEEHHLEAVMPRQESSGASAPTTLHDLKAPKVAEETPEEATEADEQKLVKESAAGAVHL